MDSSTIRNLQLFASDDGSGTHGSLFWALNHTKTKFGARLLHNWLAKPVRMRKVLVERQESIKEVLEADQSFVSQLRTLLSNLPDLEKGLTTILHNKVLFGDTYCIKIKVLFYSGKIVPKKKIFSHQCSPIQYFTILDALCQMSSELSSLLTIMDQNGKSDLLQKSISETVCLLADVQTYRDNINVTACELNLTNM